MKQLLKNTILVGVLAFSIFAHAQQDPQFTQYQYNLSVINPAYTTNETSLLNFGAFYRSQWTNVDGAPTSLSFFTHIPLSEKIEIGGTVFRDNIGESAIIETNFNTNFAYSLKLNDKSRLAFGLKIGFNEYTTDYQNLILPERQNDPVFAQDLDNTVLNYGLGTFYFFDRFYAGLSVSNLVISKLSNELGNNLEQEEAIHYFATAGYVYVCIPIGC